MSPRLAPVAGVLALAALVAAGVATRSSATPARTPAAASRAVSSVQLVCPGLDGSPQAPAGITVVDASTASTGTTPASVTLTRLPSVGPTTSASTPATLQLAPGQTTTARERLPATVVNATGPGAGQVAALQHTLVPSGPLRGLLSAPCLPATTDTWISGADGRVGHTDLLVLANPGSVEANLTVTGWSDTGRVEPPRLQSYSLPAGHSVALDLARYAPDEGLLSLHVHANVGRVAAQVRDVEAAGLTATGADWISPTAPPARHLVVTGYLPGEGPRLLVVTNPGRADASVGLRVLVRDRAFVPAGHPELTVPPGRSALLDLSASLGGEAAAVELTSDQPLVAAGMSRVTATGGVPDLQWQPAGSPLDRAAVLPDNAPPFGNGAVLFLTAVGAPAEVRLVAPAGDADAIVDVPADRTVPADLLALLGAQARGAVAVVPVTGSVWAVRGLRASGTHGPLVTAVAPVPAPLPLRLPAVVEDLRIAVR